MTMSMGLPRSGGGREATAVLGGRDVQCPEERTSHGLGGAEPAAAGDGVDRVAGLLEASTCGFESCGLDEACRRAAGLLAEATGEVPRAHRRVRGQRLDREVSVQVLGDVVLHVAQRVAVRGLQRQLRAELRLVAGTPE